MFQLKCMRHSAKALSRVCLCNCHVYESHLYNVGALLYVPEFVTNNVDSISRCHRTMGRR